jgi:hydroxyethylthiazole kinase-like uncharacterized protein yjeF
VAAFTEWTADDAALRIAVPSERDDKYSRGVLGVITGSDQYPGAAVLGVDAALRTGVGMVRYLGPERATQLVLQRRPEAVASDGRVQAWLLGSGMDPVGRDVASLTGALEQPVPVVLDGGALDLHARAEGRVIMTPHAGEFARLLGVDRAEVARDPAALTRRAADALGVTVLLKGHTTHVAGPGVSLAVRSAPTWLATAGAGDALGGILGALVATHSRQVADDPAELARLGATAAVLHGLAAARASGGGPFTVLDLTAALPAVIAELISR